MMNLEEKKRESWRMFNRIARRYDLLNRLLSFKRDVAWRKKLIDHMPEGEAQAVVDLASGTADVLLELIKRRRDVRLAVGVDPALGMLAVGKKKANGTPIALVNGDAHHLGLKSESAQVMTMAFGIRNVADMSAAFREMRRVLAPGGRLLILEFSQPENRFMRAVYLVYLRNLMPLIGGVISGDAAAYRYLNKTVEDFPFGERFCELLRTAGFVDVGRTPLTFGVATIYSAQNPN